MKTTKHTPTPWQLGEITNVDQIVANDNRLVCSVKSARNTHEQSANAAFIVRAVNRDHFFEKFIELLLDYEIVTDKTSAEWLRRKNHLLASAMNERRSDCARGES